MLSQGILGGVKRQDVFIFVNLQQDSVDAAKIVNVSLRIYRVWILVNSDHFQEQTSKSVLYVQYCLVVVHLVSCFFDMFC